MNYSLIGALSVLFALATPINTVAKEDPIGIVTGSKTGTYIQFGQDIANVAKTVGLNIMVKDSQGSINNIKRINSKENAAFGIVQSDILGFLTRSKLLESRQVASQLRLIFPFYNEEVHLFANKSIKSFSDLQGKRIIVGTEGSGTWLTAINLLQLGGITSAKRIHQPPLEGVTTVLKGEADAMFYVAGKPVKLFSKLSTLAKKPDFAPLLANTHFVPLNDPRMLTEYQPAEISPSDYSWMEDTIPTIAVKAVLMSFDFSARQNAYSRKRCRQLELLGQAIRDNLDSLRKKGHPKWKEVDLDEKVGTWKLDTCSRSNSSDHEKKSNKSNDIDITQELRKAF